MNKRLNVLAGSLPLHLPFRSRTVLPDLRLRFHIDDRLASVLGLPGKYTVPISAVIPSYNFHFRTNTKQTYTSVLSV